jgi:hypothetical protein
MPFTYAHYNQTLSKGQTTSWKAQENKIPSLSSNAQQFKIAKLPKIRKASVRFAQFNQIAPNAQFKIAKLQD